LTAPALRLAWMTLALLGLGCVHADVGNPEWGPESIAFAHPELTQGGANLAPRLEAHAGESGLYVLRNGLDAFAARVRMVDRAERSIDVQYYIYHDDLTGRYLFSRLLAAAERGVRVRLLVDDIGSAGMDRMFAAANAHPNMEIRLFNALARGPLPGVARVLDLVTRPRRLNHRMHNKMLTVDGLAAVVGGRNIGDEYFDADPEVNFVDTDLLALGPVLTDLGHSFDLYWNSEFTSPISGWQRFRVHPETATELRKELDAFEAEADDTPYAERVRTSTLLRQVEDGTLELIWAPTHVVADRPEKIVARGEGLKRTLLSEQIDDYFDEASSELIIVSPYFVPQDSGVVFLSDAVKRGVKTRVLTNSLAANDVLAVHGAYKGYRKPMLEAGVELHEIKRSGDFHRRVHRRGLFGSSSASLHSKTFVFDRRYVFIGSLNLDPRSVDLNTEIGLVVDSVELGEEWAASFERAVDPEISWRVELDEDGDLVWKGSDGGQPREFHEDPQTSWWQRFTSGVLGLLPIEGQL
jgi:putative cardiolipin synthase